ncbi:hypothetical protein J6P59_07365 [bacterium]|nr:hypothetical protein [bacterium]MBO6022890.1 hypothetical protein [bacterium]MBO6042407.1 hypothetical protein [bacterium]MBO6073385.1 hypothetical protein [bacterium]MBO7043342.1 hypothetical protein [bacterium]
MFDSSKDFNNEKNASSKNNNNTTSNSNIAKKHTINKSNKKSTKKIDLARIFTFGLNKNTDEFNQRIYVESKLDRVRLHASSVFFAGMYDDKRIMMRYAVAFVSAIIYALITFYFVDITGLYSSGTSGLFQGLARLIGTSLSLHGLSQNVSNDVYQGLF